MAGAPVGVLDLLLDALLGLGFGEAQLAQEDEVTAIHRSAVSWMGSDSRSTRAGGAMDAALGGWWASGIRPLDLPVKGW